MFFLVLNSESETGNIEAMDAMRKDWFDAVSNGNIEQIQQLIRDEIPVDIVNEVKTYYYVPM